MNLNEYEILLEQSKVFVAKHKALKDLSFVFVNCTHDTANPSLERQPIRNTKITSNSLNTKSKS